MLINVPMSVENWKTKYQYKTETTLQTFFRVSRTIAQVEGDEYGSSDSEVIGYTDAFLKTLVNFEKVQTDPLKITPSRYYQQETEPIEKAHTDLYVDPQGQLWRAVGLKATPGGRITANAGTAFDSATLLNCFVVDGVKGAEIRYMRATPDGEHEIPVLIKGDPDTPDDLLNIMVSLAAQAKTLSNEGGYGINFDFIRPRGSLIKGTGVRHPGVVAYMEVWDKVAEMIVRGDSDGYRDTLKNHLPSAEDGVLDMIEAAVKKMPRKGAQMGCLSVWHPDIEEFVRAKQTKGRLTKFNLSVVADDLFMEAVEADDFYDLHFAGRTHKRVRARELYDLIMSSSYTRNEPGVLFSGNMDRRNPILYMGATNATNPCGEVPGNPYTTTVCLLGSINLTQYVKSDRTFDWERYKADVRTFARMLENVNDIGNVPLPDYAWALKNVRQYGMGINGLGSALYMMGLTYGSPDGQAFTEEVNRLKENLTWETSALLAEERGPAPAFDAERFFSTPWYTEYADLDAGVRELMEKHGVRNLKTTTNPPLGNSSVICDMVSNGIEPVFSQWYERTVIADKWPEGLDQDNVYDLLEEIQVGDATAWRGEYDGRVWYYEPHNRGLCFVERVEDYGYAWVRERFPQDIEEDASYLVTAQDLSVHEHVDVQAVCQKHVNQSISKTSNLPNDYPFEDFKDLYMNAWKRGLIGFTTYRAGTMETVLSTGNDDSLFIPEHGNLVRSLMHAGCTPEDADLTEEGVIIRQVKLPDTFANGPTHQVRREGSKFYFHLSYLKEDSLNPIAFWIHSNDYREGEYVTLNRAVKAVRRMLIDAGVEPGLVLDQVEKIASDAYHVKLGKIISMAMRHAIPLPQIVASISGIEGDYISTTLTAVRKFLSEQIEDGVKAVGASCPACDSTDVVYESGCSTCRSCGHSGCGA